MKWSSLSMYLCLFGHTYYGMPCRMQLYASYKNVEATLPLSTSVARAPFTHSYTILVFVYVFVLLLLDNILNGTATPAVIEQTVGD